MIALLTLKKFMVVRAGILLVKNRDTYCSALYCMITLAGSVLHAVFSWPIESKFSSETFLSLTSFVHHSTSAWNHGVGDSFNDCGSVLQGLESNHACPDGKQRRTFSDALHGTSCLLQLSFNLSC